MVWWYVGNGFLFPVSLFWETYYILLFWARPDVDICVYHNFTLGDGKHEQA